ncbi:MAG: hypothetical protein J0I06_26255 [Planctomycetes bacterium]|nr:hypothetical protein [Planctomycetota bacterium]
MWGVCRSARPYDLHAAEDAFQATFLALAVPGPIADEEVVRREVAPVVP